MTTTVQFWGVPGQSQKMRFVLPSGTTYILTKNPKKYGMVSYTKARADVPITPAANLLNGGSEFAAASIPLEWQEMDEQEYLNLQPYHLQPCTMIDMDDIGYYGWLVLGGFDYLPGVQTKVGVVKAQFIVSTPANGLNSVINTIPINLCPDSDSLTNWTFSGLTQATGGPSGATDAEYTGTGSAIGSFPTLARLVPVKMGQTYTVSFWIDPSAITNNDGTRYHAYLYSVDGLGGTHDTYFSGTSAGRYALSAWTCPTNLAPTSDSLTGWTPSTSSIILSPSGGPNGAKSFQYTVPSGGQTYQNAYFVYDVTQGQEYTFSCWCNPSCCSSGGLWFRVLTADGTGIIAQHTVTGPDGRHSFSVSIPSQYSQVRFVMGEDASVGTIPVGNTAIFSDPMLEAAPSASGYYISSENPQIQVVAGPVSSAIVANGQKFKISHPMFRIDGVSNTYAPQSNPVLSQTTGGSIASGTTLYYGLTFYTNWGQTIMGPISSITTNASGSAIALNWTAPSSAFFRKARLWISTSNNLAAGASALVKADVYSAWNQTWTDYCGTNGVTSTDTIPSSNTAYTGYWSGGRFLSTT